MIKQLRTKTDQELGKLISDLKMRLLEARFKLANGNTEDMHKMRELKKTIAIAMTILSERGIKVSFSTFDTQLIKKVNDKQTIITISRLDKKKTEHINKKSNQSTEKVIEQKQEQNLQPKKTINSTNKKIQLAKKVSQNKTKTVTKNKKTSSSKSAPTKKKG